MIKNVCSRLMAFLHSALILSVMNAAFISNTQAVPSEVFGYLKVNLFEYHQRLFDAQGNEITYPDSHLIDLAFDSDPPQTLFSNDTPLGEDITVHFADDDDWARAVTSVVKLDDSGNPNRHETLNWHVEPGKLIINGRSRPLEGFNGRHFIEVRARGYAPRYATLHLVKPAPKLYVVQGRPLYAGQEIALKLKPFQYRFQNPIYQVSVNGFELAPHEYRLAADRITLLNHVIRNQGKHRVQIKAWGYENVERTLVINPAMGPLPTVPEPPTPATPVPPFNGEGPLINTAVVLPFDLIVNAHVVNALKLETTASKRIEAAWHSAEKTMFRISKKGDIFYDWEDFTYEAMDALASDQYFDVDDYISHNPIRYSGRPYQVKHVLASSQLGASVAFNQAIAQPAPKAIIEITPDGVVEIVFHQDARLFFEGLEGIKVGATQLWPDEYQVDFEENAIRLLNQNRLIEGSNALTLWSKSFRNLELSLEI